MVEFQNGKKMRLLLIVHFRARACSAYRLFEFAEPYFAVHITNWKSANVFMFSILLF